MGIKNEQQRTPDKLQAKELVDAFQQLIGGPQETAVTTLEVKGMDKLKEAVKNTEKLDKAVTQLSKKLLRLPNNLNIDIMYDDSKIDKKIIDRITGIKKNIDYNVGKVFDFPDSKKTIKSLRSSSGALHPLSESSSAALTSVMDSFRQSGGTNVVEMQKIISDMLQIEEHINRLGKKITKKPNDLYDINAVVSYADALKDMIRATKVWIDLREQVKKANHGDISFANFNPNIQGMYEDFQKRFESFQEEVIKDWYGQFIKLNGKFDAKIINGIAKAANGKGKLKGIYSKNSSAIEETRSKNRVSDVAVYNEAVAKMYALGVDEALSKITDIVKSKAFKKENVSKDLMKEFSGYLTAYLSGGGESGKIDKLLKDNGIAGDVNYYLSKENNYLAEDITKEIERFVKARKSAADKLRELETKTRNAGFSERELKLFSNIASRYKDELKDENKYVEVLSEAYEVLMKVRSGSEKEVRDLFTSNSKVATSIFKMLAKENKLLIRSNDEKKAALDYLVANRTPIPSSDSDTHKKNIAATNEGKKTSVDSNDTNASHVDTDKVKEQTDALNKLIDAQERAKSLGIDVSNLVTPDGSEVKDINSVTEAINELIAAKERAANTKIGKPNTDIDTNIKQEDNKNLQEKSDLYKEIYNRIEKIRMLGAVGATKKDIDDIAASFGFESRNMDAYRMQMEAMKKLTPSGQSNPDVRDMVLTPNISVEEVTNKLIEASEVYIDCKNALDKMFEKAGIVGGHVYDSAYRNLDMFAMKPEEMFGVVGDAREKLALIKKENEALEEQRRIVNQQPKTSPVVEQQEQILRNAVEIKAAYDRMNQKSNEWGRADIQRTLNGDYNGYSETDSTRTVLSQLKNAHEAYDLSMSNGWNWEDQYQWAVKFVTLYEQYQGRDNGTEKSLLKHAELYQRLSPLVEGYRKELQKVLDFSQKPIPQLSEVANGNISTKHEETRTQDNTMQSSKPSDEYIQNEINSLSKLDSKLYETRAVIGKKSEEFETEKNVAKNAINSEIADLSRLISKLTEVRESIRKKSEEFETEKTTVSQVVSAEIGELDKLIGKLKEVIQTIGQYGKIDFSVLRDALEKAIKNVSASPDVAIDTTKVKTAIETAINSATGKPVIQIEPVEIKAEIEKGIGLVDRKANIVATVSDIVYDKKFLPDLNAETDGQLSINPKEIDANKSPLIIDNIGINKAKLGAQIEDAISSSSGTPDIKIDKAKISNDIGSAIDNTTINPSVLTENVTEQLKGASAGVNVRPLVDGPEFIHEVESALKDFSVKIASDIEFDLVEKQKKPKASEEATTMAKSIAKELGVANRSVISEAALEIDDLLSGAKSNVSGLFDILAKDGKAGDAVVGVLTNQYSQIMNYIKSSKIKKDPTFGPEFGDDWQNVRKTIGPGVIGRNGVDIDAFIDDLNEVFKVNVEHGINPADSLRNLFDFIDKFSVNISDTLKSQWTANGHGVKWLNSAVFGPSERKYTLAQNQPKIKPIISSTTQTSSQSGSTNSIPVNVPVNPVPTTPTSSTPITPSNPVQVPVPANPLPVTGDHERTITKEEWGTSGWSEIYTDAPGHKITKGQRIKKDGEYEDFSKESFSYTELEREGIQTMKKLMKASTDLAIENEKLFPNKDVVKALSDEISGYNKKLEELRNTARSFENKKNTNYTVSQYDKAVASGTNAYEKELDTILAKELSRISKENEAYKQNEYNKKYEKNIEIIEKLNAARTELNNLEAKLANAKPGERSGLIEQIEKLEAELPKLEENAISAHKAIEELSAESKIGVGKKNDADKLFEEAILGSKESRFKKENAENTAEFNEQTKAVNTLKKSVEDYVSTYNTLIAKTKQGAISSEWEDAAHSVNNAAEKMREAITLAGANGLSDDKIKNIVKNVFSEKDFDPLLSVQDVIQKYIKQIDEFELKLGTIGESGQSNIASLRAFLKSISDGLDVDKDTFDPLMKLDQFGQSIKSVFNLIKDTNGKEIKFKETLKSLHDSLDGLADFDKSATKISSYGDKIREFEQEIKQIRTYRRRDEDGNILPFTKEDFEKQLSDLEDVEKRVKEFIKNVSSYEEKNKNGTIVQATLGEISSTEKLQSSLAAYARAAELEYGEIDNIKVAQSGEKVTMTFKEQDGVIRTLIGTWDKYNNSMRITESFQEKFSKSSNFWSGLLEETGRYVTMTMDVGDVIMWVRGQFSKAIETFKAYDASLTNVSYTMDMTREGLYDLGSDALDMAEDLALSVENAMGIYEIYANMNTTAQEIKDVATPTAILANISGNDTDTTSDQIQGVLQQFNMLEDEANNVADASMHVVDVLADISANVAIDNVKAIGIMADAVQAAGAEAYQAGLSFEQLAAISAKVSERTRDDGSSIGNALKTIIVRLSKVGKMPGYADEVSNEELSNASKSLNEIGIQVYESNGEFRQLDVILGELSAKWDTLTDAQQANISYNVAA